MIPPSGPCPAQVMVIGEYPSDLDLARQEPFSGGAGMELNRMLEEAGLNRSMAFLTYVVRTCPPRGDITRLIPDKKKDITPSHVGLNGKLVLPVVVEHYNLLLKEIELCQPKVIIALGNVALWALTSKWGIKNYRGSQLSTSTGIPVIPTYHPVLVLRQWSIRSVVVQDLRKAANVLYGRASVKPAFRFTLRPTYEKALSTLQEILARLDTGPCAISTDIETRTANRELHIMCIALAWSKLDAICIPFVETQKFCAHYWQEEEEANLVYLLYRIHTHPNVRLIWQNGLFDAQYMYRSWHFVGKNTSGPLGGDTMLAHHACFSSMQKSLDFLASLHCEFYTYWKGAARELNKIGGKVDD